MNETSFNIKRFDTLMTGIISGILLPVLVYFVLYHSKVQDVRFTLFSHRLVIGNVIPIILSHCILPNLLLFFIYMGVNWIRAAKGILGSTVVLTVAIFAIKFVFSLL